MDREVYLTKIREDLADCEEHLKNANHMIYVGFSVLKEKRIIIKVVSEIAEAVSSLVKAFLYFELMNGRVRLSKNPEENLRRFEKKVAPRYFSKEEIEEIIKILRIQKAHKKAQVEFVRKETFVILVGDKYEKVGIGDVRVFLVRVKKMLMKFPKENI